MSFNSYSTHSTYIKLANFSLTYYFTMLHDQNVDCFFLFLFYVFSHRAVRIVGIKLCKNASSCFSRDKFFMQYFDALAANNKTASHHIIHRGDFPARRKNKSRKKNWLRERERNAIFFSNEFSIHFHFDCYN